MRDGEVARGARQAERQRQAAVLLRITAATADYAAGQLADGLSPAQARAAVVEAAGELEAAAAGLRRLAQLSHADRRRLALMLTGAGVPRREIAMRLGCSERSVFRYLGHP